MGVIVGLVGIGDCVVVRNGESEAGRVCCWRCVKRRSRGLRELEGREMEDKLIL